MNGSFMRGILVGAAAGAVAELMVLGYDKTARTRAKRTVHAMEDAVDDAVDNIARVFR